MSSPASRDPPSPSATLPPADAVERVNPPVVTLDLSKRSAWRFEPVDTWFRFTAVGDRFIFVEDQHDILYAVDRGSGAEAWRVELPRLPQTLLAIEVADGKVYAKGLQLLVIEEERGEVLTRLMLPSGKFAVDGGSLFVAGHQHLLRLDPDASRYKQRWRAELRGAVTGLLVADGGGDQDKVVLAGSELGYLYRFDAATGEQRWRLTTEGPSAPLGAEGDICCALSWDRHWSHTLSLAIGCGDGKERWRLRLTGPAYSVEVDAGRWSILHQQDEEPERGLYLHSLETRAKQRDRACRVAASSEGREHAWRHIEGGWAVLADGRGSVMLVDLKTCRRAALQVGRPMIEQPPLLLGTTLVYGSTDGVLYGLDVGEAIAALRP